jgi:multisubunit Na+/H+ antiporter MnhG subunit
MNLDIRLPIGLLFTLLGGILAAYGLMTGPETYTRSLGHNLNLSWGLAVLAFGLVFLFLGRRGTSAATPADASAEGRATEAREHDAGLESERPRHGH